MANGSNVGQGTVLRLGAEVLSMLIALSVVGAVGVGAECGRDRALRLRKVLRRVLRALG